MVLLPLPVTETANRGFCKWPVRILHEQPSLPQRTAASCSHWYKIQIIIGGTQVLAPFRRFKSTQFSNLRPCRGRANTSSVWIARCRFSFSGWPNALCCLFWALSWPECLTLTSLGANGILQCLSCCLWRGDTKSPDTVPHGMGNQYQGHGQRCVPLARETVQPLVCRSLPSAVPQHKRHNPDGPQSLVKGSGELPVLIVLRFCLCYNPAKSEHDRFSCYGVLEEYSRQCQRLFSCLCNFTLSSLLTQMPLPESTTGRRRVGKLRMAADLVSHSR